jgi:hypothetical protein
MGIFQKKTLTTKATLLTLEIPRNNDKKELAAEQLFASLHGILRDRKELKLNGGIQEHISFEMASTGQLIRFYVWVPEALRTFVEGQIYAQYPTVQIHETEEDYARRAVQGKTIASAEITLTDNEFLPIKTFQSFEVDPLAGITATLSKLHNDKEEVWVQILVKPINDSWHIGAANVAKSIKLGGGGDLGLGALGQVISILSKPLDPSEKPEISERDKSRVTEIEKKIHQAGFQCAHSRWLYWPRSKQRQVTAAGCGRRFQTI